jgi:hypothetical protein
MPAIEPADKGAAGDACRGAAEGTGSILMALHSHGLTGLNGLHLFMRNPPVKEITSRGMVRAQRRRRHAGLGRIFRTTEDAFLFRRDWRSLFFLPRRGSSAAQVPSNGLLRNRDCELNSGNLRYRCADLVQNSNGARPMRNSAARAA